MTGGTVCRSLRTGDTVRWPWGTPLMTGGDVVGKPAHSGGATTEVGKPVRSGRATTEVGKPVRPGGATTEIQGANNHHNESYLVWGFGW